MWEPEDLASNRVDCGWSGESVLNQISTIVLDAQILVLLIHWSATAMGAKCQQSFERATKVPKTIGLVERWLHVLINRLWQVAVAKTLKLAEVIAQEAKLKKIRHRLQ
jgi:hypothetical protein